MFKQLFELTTQFLSLAKDLQQNKSDLKDVGQEVKELRRDFNELRREVRDVATALQRLAYEIHRTGEHEASERKLLTLALENAFLKFERRLPASDKPSAEEA